VAVGELFVRYSEDRFGDLRESTQQCYRWIWGKYLEHRFASLRLDELAGEHIWKMRREMEATPTAFNMARQQLRACLEHGITLEWLPQGGNKVDLVPKAKVEHRKRKLYFTPEEYQRFGEALRRAEQERRHSYPRLAAVWVLLTTGCRPGEVIRAKRSWAVLDDKHPRIEVKRHKGQRKGKPGPERVLWLHPAVAEKLRRIEHPPGNPWLIPGRKPGQPVNSLFTLWASLCEMAGIEGSSHYTARHSYRSEAAEAKIQTERVQVLMGHRPGSKVTNSTYLHTHERQKIAAARQMEEHLGRLVGLVEPGEEGPHAAF
jgi:integrase